MASNVHYTAWEKWGCIDRVFGIPSLFIVSRKHRIFNIDFFVCCTIKFEKFLHRKKQGMITIGTYQRYKPSPSESKQFRF